MVAEVTTHPLAGRRILLGVSGGIAAVKAPFVARQLVQAGAVVDTVLTRGALHFVGRATFEGITGRPVRTEVWEDVERETHVALARAADAIVLYPATAHLLARAAAGLADDLLTTSLLAATCPVVAAPAMHTEMWQHASTQDNVGRLRSRGMRFVGPETGELMGGDRGPGRASEPPEVVAALRELFAAGPLRGLRVLVTAGGTREALDPVRFLGNRSSGRMGFAIAEEGVRRGADVVLVSAPSELPTPAGVERVDVVSAREMHAAVLDHVSDAEVVVKAAAVADFRPATAAASKLKKDHGPPTVELVPNPDILADLGQRRRETGGTRPLLVGFAAETDAAEANGRAKLERKGVDLLVVNDVGAPGAGFEVDTNRVLILTRDGERIEVPLTTKAAVAARLWDEIAGFRARHGRAAEPGG